MSLITTNPANDQAADLQATAAPFRRTRPAPAFRPEIGRSLRMHPRVALAVGLAVLAVALAYGLSLKPSYMAESRIYIEPAVSSPLSDPNAGGLFDSVRYDSYLQQQMQTATRVDILKTAIQSLPAGTWTLPGETLESAAHRLGAALKVARVTTSYQMSIGLTGPDPKKTAAVVNAVTTAYLDAGRRDELSHSTSRAQILTEERDRITRELGAARAEQAALGAALGVASPGTAVVNHYDEQLTALRGELISARQAHDAAAAQLTSVAGPNATAAPGLNALATEMAAGDAGLSSLKASVNQRRATLEEQMAGMTPNNPAYKLDQDELADLNKVLSSMETQLRDQAARRLEDKLRTELQRTGDMEARLNGELAHGTSVATGAAPKLERSQELTAEITRLTARFATIDDALRTLELETHGMPMAHLSLAAAVPSQPEPSRRKLVLLAALPLALMAACFAASVLHRRERRVYIAQDMEDLLGFTPIAVLPARADVSAPVLEEYVLRLAGGIENAYRSRGARTFVLTPVSASTTLDFLTELLAAKLTALGLEVATVHAADMLDGPAPMSALTTQGPHEGRMVSALDQLKASYNLIFIAAPALLTSAEAEYVARLADATILVAECGVTLKEELTESAVLLERLQVTGVGTVLDELKMRYADRAFRTAVTSVEARVNSGEAPRRYAPEPAAQPVMQQPVMQQPDMQHEAQPVAPAYATAVEDAPAPPPVAQLFTPAADAVVEPIAEPLLQVHAAIPPIQSEAPVIHSALEETYAPAEAYAAAPSVVSELPEPIAAEPALHFASKDTPFTAEPFAEPAARPVWPAANSRLEPSTAVRAFEQELLSAKGTAVFLTPRAASERHIERLEPLGTQDSLAPAAEMLAASFGKLPMEIEPTPGEVVFPDGTTPEEAEGLRIARANRAALANGKPLGPVAEPLQMDEIRRLLNPVKAETTIETRSGKDMIGARAVSDVARQTQLDGWATDGEAGMSAKKNWFQKLFQRDTEPGFSVVPGAGEDESSLEDPTYTSARSHSLYDLPTSRNSYSHDNGGGVALAEAPAATAEQYVEQSRREEELVVAEAPQSNGFRPVARVVSLLTPLDEPAQEAAADVVAAPPVFEPAPVVAAVPPAMEVSPERFPEPKSAAAAPKSPAPVLPPPAARRPKSFFELTQARRRPAIAALVAERAIAVSATPSMLQDEVPEAQTLPAVEAAVEHVETPIAEEVHAVAEQPAITMAEPAAADVEETPAAVEEPAAMAAADLEEAQPAVSEVVTASPELPRFREPQPIYEPAHSSPAAPAAREEWSAPAAYRAPEPARRSPAQWPTSTAASEYPGRVRLTEERSDAHQEPRLQTRGDSRPAPLDPALSRRWGLLSRYQQADRPQPDANGDDFRRGRE